MADPMDESTVSDVMLRNPKTLASDVTVAEARAALEHDGTYSVLLVDGSRFRGAVTAIPADADPDGPARRFVDEAAAVVHEDTPVSDALALLDEKSHGRVVVLDGERLAGLVCLTADGQRFCGRPGAMSA
jgi:CBS domain-containing protein